MIEWLKEILHFLQFVYNNLLIFENYDKVMTPPIERGVWEVMGSPSKK